MSDDLIACPRCNGSWWRREETLQMPKHSSYPQPPDLPATICSGSSTPFIPFASAVRWVFVCSSCGFPNRGARQPR